MSDDFCFVLFLFGVWFRGFLAYKIDGCFNFIVAVGGVFPFWLLKQFLFVSDPIRHCAKRVVMFCSFGAKKVKR